MSSVMTRLASRRRAGWIAWAGAFAIALFCLMPVAATAAGEAPRVVATIKPVHALVARVMAGAGEPAPLLQGAASAHTYSLRPSEARLLASADLVFWIGPDYEAFLVRPLAALGNGRAVALIDAEGITTLAPRQGGLWHKDDGHGHGHPREDGGGPRDTHIWLDPANAIAMTAAIADALAEADPGRASLYAANAAAARAEIEALDRRLAKALAPLANRPYFVFHDAYQYFEARYGLRPAGAIMVTPGHLPGARRLGAIRARIEQAGALCVFAEPQFEPRLVETVAAGTPARTGVLDPLGMTTPAGAAAYAAILEGLAGALTACLTPGDAIARRG
jgi:zinc transport system substrate-binding protein